MKIEKKCWTEFFEKVLSGEKNFEVRLADFECRAGDVLVLREWDPKTKEYTGRQIEKTVGFVLKTKDLSFWPKEEVDKYGYMVMGLK
jgi:ribosomal protein S17